VVFEETASFPFAKIFNEFYASNNSTKKMAAEKVVINSQEYAYGANITLRGLNVKFNVQDEFGNKIDTILLVRNNPDFGQMTYTLTKAGGARDVVLRKNIIFLGRSEAFSSQIFINEIEVGDYILELEIPSSQDLSIPITVKSNSSQLSMNQNFADFDRSGRPLALGEGEHFKSHTIAYRVGYEVRELTKDGMTGTLQSESSQEIPLFEAGLGATHEEKRDGAYLNM
jgi:hypothetical protein